MKLTEQHIELIRNYFLADNDEKKLSIEKSIDQLSLSQFVTELKEIFNNNEDYENELIDLATRIEAKEHLGELQCIQQDYYSNLAVIYNAGISNSAIDHLLQVKHDLFLQEIEFQKQLSIAFQLNERSDLKKQFAVQNNVDEINGEELNLAFKLGERQKLKQQFIEVDREEHSISKIEGKIISFNWKKLAAAASVIAIILTTTFILFNKDKKPQNIAAVPAINKKHLADSISNRKTIQDRFDAQLANTIIPKDSRQSKVISDQTLGFGPKEESILIEVYDLSEPISIINKEISEDSLLNGFGTNFNLAKQKIDSLMALRNTYKFNNDTLSIYTLSKQRVKVIKVNTAYFIQLRQNVYEGKKSTSFSLLKVVNDKIILKKVQDILSINTN